MNPQVAISRHPQSSSNLSTAQNTASNTTDHPYRYTRAQTPLRSHVLPHATHPPTQRWPNPAPVACTSPRSTSPELSPRPHPPHQLGHGVGPSSLPDNEQPSSPMTSSPLLPPISTELPHQSTSCDQKSLESLSGKKRHKCNICGSYWGRPSSLKIHMVSHTGVKGARLLSPPLAAILISTA